MLTIEMLWTQAHLFPQQLWQRLNQLGRKILAAMIACLLPFALFLGISSPGRSKAPITINALANLLQVPLPPDPYRNTPTDLQSDRRGLMSENREDIDRFSTFLISPVDLLSSDSVLFKTIVPHSLLPTFDAGTNTETGAWIGNWTVYLDSSPDRPFTTKVTAIDAEASFTPENIYFKKDRVQQVFGVRLAIQAPGGFAKPGMPVDAKIDLEQK